MSIVMAGSQQRYTPPSLEEVARALRCRVCGSPMPVERLRAVSRARHCSRACTVWLADLRRKERNTEEHGVTRPRSRSARVQQMWLRAARKETA